MVEVVTSEAMLRNRVASQSALPKFDQTVLGKRDCGLAVLEVALRKDGELLHASILEAPTAAIGDQVRLAVSHWRFKPIQDERMFILKGKLSFYLIKEQSAVTTVNPEEVGFIGTCSSPSTI
ncbi:hypothetical protein [Lysobacter sp. CFH 32150]|uniref:hypothetical protein n=1 Tax=Lysobacter sp. CFH 32150 TaxID=2927128 RepID=UPI001FA6C0DB|nr:hypothetical protein [Lysobacter sp. CFH 32150]MCI4568947.1 hypothetical protein [Lysobacter sp. CFH 32150]